MRISIERRPKVFFSTKITKKNIYTKNTKGKFQFSVCGKESEKFSLGTKFQENAAK